MNRTTLNIILTMLTIVAAGCNIGVPAITPTAEILLSATVTSSPSATASPSPSEVATTSIIEVPVQVASPLPTLAPDNINPTLVVPPTATLGPCSETVQQGDTLTIILFRQPCGNAITQDLIQAVVRINTNLSNPDILPPVGSEILIPLPTATSVPEGLALTEAAAATRGVTTIGGQVVVQGQNFGEYEVQEGDTLVRIMETFDTTLEMLSMQNPNLNWFGCDFTNPSGGPNCNPAIGIGQRINVPLPTATAVPTGTPSGDETPTATPTHGPVLTFYPPHGAMASGRVQLMWVSAGLLQDDEHYLIEITDGTNNNTQSFVTNRTSFFIPDHLIPGDGQMHRVDWRVSVAERNDDGTYTLSGAAGAWRYFQWQR